MNTYLSYTLESNAYLAIFALAYAALWSGQKYLILNRTVLLGSMAVSLILPLVQSTAMPQLFAWRAVELPVFKVGLAAQPGISSTTWSFTYVWIAVYLTGVVISGVSLWRKWRNTFALVRKPPQKLQVPAGKTIEFRDGPPSSFFGYLFLPAGLDAEEAEQIIAHEMVHAKELHSVDLLLVRCLQVIFWFNPAVYYFRRAIEANHEFRADEVAAKKCGDAVRYSQTLLSFALGVKRPVIAHPFSETQLLKKRIAMLHQNQPSKFGFSKYLLFLPIAAAVLFIHGCQDDSEITPLSEDKSQTGLQKNLEQIEYVGKDIPVGKKMPGTDYYLTVDVMPEFKGGTGALMDYLGKEITYPADAREEGIEGVVFVSFVVTAQGEAEEVKVLKSPDDRLSAAALKAFENMPTWIPGSHAGENVPVQYNLPVGFSLE